MARMMTSNPKANAALVEALGSALREGEHGLKTGPALLIRVLREESWRSFVTQRGDHVEHQRFEHFVTRPPLKGLGGSMRLIGKLIDAIEDEAQRTQTQDLLDQTLRGAQGRRTDLVDNINEVSRPSGTSQAAALRRLRKDAPDLHAEVLSGRLSAHAAMVQAGFRRKTATIPVDTPANAARALQRNMEPAELAELARLITERQPYA